MQDPFSLAQILGYIGLATTVGAYFFKSENVMKLGFAGSNLFWIAHYYLLGAHTAALTTIVVVVRNLLALNSPNFSTQRKTIKLLVFSTLLILVGIFSWAGWITLIPVITCIIATYTVFFVTGIKFRINFFVIDLAWLVHGLVVMSYSGVLYAVGAMAANGYMIYKMHKVQT